ncbi:MAG: glycoside hydrolase family 57 [bacterium]|jgi:hypothetical protein|nr:glycoside hydrolase family 57 [bacterium]
MKPGIIFMPHANLQYSQLPPQRRGWVARETYGRIFDLAEMLDIRLAFEASGETLEIMASEAPETLEKLIAGVNAGRIEPVASPQTHIMIPNVGRELGLNSLLDGLDTWERFTGVRPVTGWNPECGWTHYVPDIFREAGFEILIADADSYLLSTVKGLREATGLRFDVRGHSNKNALFRIEDEIAGHPEILQALFKPNHLENGLKVILRSDMLCNIILWYLMGATEGNRQTPVAIEEVKELLVRWQGRMPDKGFLMPYAEDAEYIGTTAYFFVKQYGLARFFEPAPESAERFEEVLQLALNLGFEFILPRETPDRYGVVETRGFGQVESGCAWHGGTARAWANTAYSRILDPVCRTIYEGLQAVASEAGLNDLRGNATSKCILQSITTAYVSDSRWPPAPTSPGRFNVEEALNALEQANESMSRLMAECGLADQKALYSPELMATQIAAVRDELMSLNYFGEDKE